MGASVLHRTYKNTYTTVHCRSGAHTIVFSKPGFMGIWYDVAHFNSTEFWEAFGGTAQSGLTVRCAPLPRVLIGKTPQSRSRPKLDGGAYVIVRAAIQSGIMEPRSLPNSTRCLNTLVGTNKMPPDTDATNMTAKRLISA